MVFAAGGRNGRKTVTAGAEHGRNGGMNSRQNAQVKRQQVEHPGENLVGVQ